MQIELSELDEGIMEIRPRENLTAANAAEFKILVQESLQKPDSLRSYLFNFTDLDFLDSSGISSIVYLHRQINKLNKSLAIVYESDQIEEVFVLTKLNKLLNLFQDYEEALEELSDWTSLQIFFFAQLKSNAWSNSSGGLTLYIDKIYLKS